jgi:hypothetical protein
MATEFDNVLNRFKRNTLDYKITGQSLFKQQADVDEKWLNEYINALNTSVDRDAAFIDKFAKTYASTNPDLMKYKGEIAEARVKGPELQDIYEAEQEVRQEIPLDETLYYTKAAVVGGILALAAVVTFL